MPCSLKPTPLQIPSCVCLAHGSPPLLIWFEYGYCPVGVFCCLVVYLLQQSSFLCWRLAKQQHFRNKVTFTLVPNSDLVSLSAHPTYIEVNIQTRFTAMEYTSLMQLCVEIRSTLDVYLEKVTLSLHYCSKYQHLFGLYCCSCSCLTLSPYPAVHIWSEHVPIPKMLHCVSNKYRAFAVHTVSHALIWYNQVSNRH